MDTTNERTARLWFARFLSGYFNLTIKPRERTELTVNNDEMRAIVNAHPSQTTEELPRWFGITMHKILTCLRQIDKLKI